MLILLGQTTALLQGNTGAPDMARGTALMLLFLAALELISTLLGCLVLLWGGTLAAALEDDLFSGRAVALAEETARRCAQAATVSVVLCAGGDLLQMALFSSLCSINTTLSFPAGTVLLSAALFLLCRCLRRAKAVSDENDTII